jgi:hypothetical protein
MVIWRGAFLHLPRPLLMPVIQELEVGNVPFAGESTTTCSKSLQNVKWQTADVAYSRKSFDSTMGATDCEDLGQYVHRRFIAIIALNTTTEVETQQEPLGCSLSRLLH